MTKNRQRINRAIGLMMFTLGLFLVWLGPLVAEPFYGCGCFCIACPFNLTSTQAEAFIMAYYAFGAMMTGGGIYMVANTVSSRLSGDQS